MRSVIVCEGKNDAARLSQIIPEALIITTNGSAVSQETIQTILALSKTNRIILFLDPDYPGEKIRKIIAEAVPNCYHAFLEKQKAIDIRKHKVGIEHAKSADLLEALQHLLATQDLSINFTKQTLYALGLDGQPDSGVLRAIVAKRLRIGYSNAKTFLKRINMLGISFSELEALICEVRQ